MSSSCPNKSHPAWKALVEKTGSEIGAYKEYINNNFSLPSSESKQDVLFQKNQTVSSEGKIASEKTIRDLASRISDRIGMSVKFESDRTKNYKGKIENDVAYINLAYATLDTPIHEILGHPIIRAIKSNKTELLSFNDWYKNKYGQDKSNWENRLQEYENYKNSQKTSNQLYQNLLKELETGRGKEVLDRIKRDYKSTPSKEYLLRKIHPVTGAYSEIKTFNSQEELDKYKKDNVLVGNSNELVRDKFGEKLYTLEEQQEEAIVELLGMMTADKLDNVKDGKLISLLKRLLKEMKQFIRSLINQKEVEIDKLPDNMTLGDLSDLLAYSNSKLILPGYEVQYTTPDNQTFKTYQEASNHISELAKSVEDVDLDNIKIESKLNYIKNGYYHELINGEAFISFPVFKLKGREISLGNTGWHEAGVFKNINNLDDLNKKFNELAKKENVTFYLKRVKDNYNKDLGIFNSFKEKTDKIIYFIEKNKEYEQSKEIIEEWKKVNNIQYNPEEIYSRGQEFSSVVGAYSSFDVNLMMQNLLQHIEDNEKAGGKFAISAFTKPIDKTIGHLEGGGGKIKFKIYPQSNDILWASNIDVFSGSVWDASEKVNKDKKSELLGVSYSKYPALRNVKTVQPNLASIVDDLQHDHNELGIALTGNNFRLEYDEDIPYQTKKIIDGVNKILDQKYGKLVKPEIENKSTFKNEYGQTTIRERLENPDYEKGQYNKVDGYYVHSQIKGELESFDTVEEAVNYIKELKAKYEKGIQPTQTKNNLKESIDSVKNKLDIFEKDEYPKTAKSVVYLESESEIKEYESKGYTKTGRISDEGFPEYALLSNKPKEYTSQALINTKIAALKEVAKKYPRSLIRSEVVRTKEYFPGEFSGFAEGDLPFQKIPKGLTDIVPKVQIENYRNVTKEDKRKALDGDLNAQKKWMQEEISEFYEAVNGFNKGTMSIDDVGEEVLGLFRTAQQFPNVKDAIAPYMNDIKTALNSIDKEDQYNKFKAKKTSKGQAKDMTFKNLFEFINSFKELKETATPLLQLKGETESSKASPKTVAVVKDFLKRIGVDIKSLTNIVVNGVKQDANGAALIMQKIVQVVEGKEDVALTEEAMHFAVEILKQTNPKLYNQLLKEINSYDIYKQVLRDYSSSPLYQTKDGKPDIQKLKDEAIAKVLTEKIINKSEGQTEKPELLQKSEGWWKAMLSWFKELLFKSGFDRATMDILSGKDIGTAQDIKAEENKVYLQKTKQDLSIEEILRVHNSITKKETGKVVDGKKEEAYFIDGRQIKKRVTEIIKDWYSRTFKDSAINESDYQKAVNDLKADKGTAGHADMEYALSRFVDENGYLRDKELPDDVDFQSKIDPTNNDMYYTLKDNLRERLIGPVVNGVRQETFPKGTRFFKEMQVYDAKRDIAGTIDFMAIEPDGKVNLLDWKFMNLDLEKFTDVPWYKINAWNQQMAQYKLILINSYGFKAQDFKQTRMIPIVANYSRGSARMNILPKLISIEIGDQNVKNIQKDYLLPVALANETTGSKAFDQLLEQLTNIYKKMSAKKIVNDEEKKSKSEQLNALFTAMRQLQIKQNIVPLLEQAKLLSLEVEKVIDEYEQKFKGKDASELTSSSDEQMRNEYSNKIADMVTALSVYTELSSNLAFLFPKRTTLSEEDAKLKEILKTTSQDAQDLTKELSDIYKEFTVEQIGKSEGEEDISRMEKTIKGVSKWLSSTATTQLSSLRVIYRKVNRQLFNAAQETVNESRKLEEYKGKYDAWARSKGVSKKEYFNILKKKNKNELIDEWDPEFYRILKEATTNREAKDYEWIRENIDVDAYKIELEKKLQQELERIDNKVRYITDANREFVEFQIEQEKQKARNTYTIEKPTSAGYLLYDTIKKFPLQKWHSTEWKTLTAPGNEPAKELYDYITEKNKEYADLGYISKREARVFLPWASKGLTERIMLGGDLSLGEQFLKSISVDDSTTGYGQIDPITGELINKIPKYLISEIDDPSEDLFKTLSLYNEFALNYKYLSQIDAQAQAIIQLERNKNSIRTSTWGNSILKNGAIDPNPDNSENAKLIEDTVKGIIYGQKYIQSETFD